MNKLEQITLDACEDLTRKFKKYEERNGSTYGFDSTSAIHLTAEAFSKLAPGEWIEVLRYDSSLLEQEYESSADSMGFVVESASNILNSILTLRLIDELHSHYHSLRGEEAEAKTIAKATAVDSMALCEPVAPYLWEELDLDIGYSQLCSETVDTVVDAAKALAQALGCDTRTGAAMIVQTVAQRLYGEEGVNA